MIDWIVNSWDIFHDKNVCEAIIHRQKYIKFIFGEKFEMLYMHSTGIKKKIIPIKNEKYRHWKL